MNWTVPPNYCQEFALIGSGHFPYGKRRFYQIANPGHLEAKEGEKRVRFFGGHVRTVAFSDVRRRHFKEAELPVKICGISQCYRSEIGSYGRITKGIYRVHEFMKVEQVILCKNDLQESEKWFQEILAIAGNPGRTETAISRH